MSWTLRSEFHLKCKKICERKFISSWSCNLYSSPEFSLQTPFSLFQFPLIQFPSILFNSIQFPSIQFYSIPFNSIQFPSIPFNSIQFLFLSSHTKATTYHTHQLWSIWLWLKKSAAADRQICWYLFHLWSFHHLCKW